MTKLGPHILGTSAQGAQWARAGARVVKLVDDFSFAAEAASLPHHPLVIGRVFENVFDPNALRSVDPSTMAESYIATHLEHKINLNPAVPAWEGPNECVITDEVTMNWYARFLYRFAEVLRTQFNKTAVIGSWSVGNPDYPLWWKYVPALTAVSRYGALLSRHNYAGPDRSTWDYLLLRHREDNYRFAALGFPDLPLVITECGADSVPFGNPPGAPWKDLYGDDAQRYCDEILFPFDAEIARDSFVVGATVFTSGAGWDRHNIEGRVGELLIAATATEPPPTDGATHIVTATLLNVRLHPWTTLAPPLVRQVPKGTRVRVEGVYKTPTMTTGWGCISPASNEWVSMRYLVEA